MVPRHCPNGEVSRQERPTADAHESLSTIIEETRNNVLASAVQTVRSDALRASFRTLSISVVLRLLLRYFSKRVSASKFLEETGFILPFHIIAEIRSLFTSGVYRKFKPKSFQSKAATFYHSPVNGPAHSFSCLSDFFYRPPTGKVRLL